MYLSAPFLFSKKRAYLGGYMRTQEVSFPFFATAKYSTVWINYNFFQSSAITGPFGHFCTFSEIKYAAVTYFVPVSLCT